MTTMSEVTAPLSGFAEAASESARVFLQLQSRGAVVVFVGGSAPASDARLGVHLETGEVEEVSFDALETGDRVFVRTLLGAPVRLLVVASDGAPA